MHKSLSLILFLGCAAVVGGLLFVIQSGSGSVPEGLHVDHAERRSENAVGFATPSAGQSGTQSTGLRPVPTGPSPSGQVPGEAWLGADSGSDWVPPDEPNRQELLLENAESGSTDDFSDDPLSRALDEIQQASKAKRAAALAEAEAEAEEQASEENSKDRPTDKKGRPVMTAMEAFEHAMGRHGTDKFSLGHVARAVQSMDTPDFPVAAEQIRNMEWNKESHYMMNALMKQWGKTDLDGALQFADQMGIRRMQNDAVGEAMEGWSSQNPDAAYNMLLRGTDPLLDHVSPSQVFRDLAKASTPQEALNRVWQLPDTDLQNKALSGVLSSLDSSERQAAARSLFQQVPTQESKTTLARAVVNDLRIYQPEEAAAFVDSIAEPDIRKTAASSLLASWAVDDPTQAMGWALAHPPSTQTERDVSSVASRWVREDPAELGDWLNRQPATPSLDPAVQAMVRSEQKQNPSSAMAWAENIIDTKDRVTSIRSVASAWMKADPTAAAPYITNHAELSDKDKARLLR